MADRICTIADCGKPHVARGLCGMHYRRQRVNGDPTVVRHWWPDPQGCSIEGCAGAHVARGLCSNHYARWRRHGDTENLQWRWHASDRDRFEERVQRTPRCWLWTGRINGAGYGSMRVDGRRIGAHVAAVIFDGREIPDGMQVDHLCFNRRCVRPDHLEVVTQQENLRRARQRT